MQVEAQGVKKATVTVAHVSDIHLAEQLPESPEDIRRLYGRYGHDFQILLALDAFLKSTDWDILVLSGDLSRGGHQTSFAWARNWLDGQLVFGKTKLGLNLGNPLAKPYLVVPGNHDRFNSKLRQHSLDNYLNEFPAIQSGTVYTHVVNGITVNLYPFDSTYDGGGFARGMVDQSDLVPVSLTRSHLDLAVLHHPFIQDGSDRKPKLELQNADRVAAHIFGSGFDAALSGHTHRSHLEDVAGQLVVRHLDNSGRSRSYWKKLMPQVLLRQITDDGLLSFRRERCRDGSFPTIDSYYEFLFLRAHHAKVRGPEECRNPAHFYEQLAELKKGSSLDSEMARLKQERVLVSVAPSACQAEAEDKGLHLLKFRFADGGLTEIEGQVYGFQHAEFALRSSEKFDRKIAGATSEPADQRSSRPGVDRISE